MTEKAEPKRPYEPPELTVYGELAQLTKGGNGSSADDQSQVDDKPH